MPTHPLDERLDGLDRDQLTALIHRLVDHEPKLADIALLPLPGERSQADGGQVAAHAARILDTMGHDWRASGHAADDLWPLVQTGQRYLQEGLAEDARTVFNAVIGAILERYERIWDHESEVGGVVGECVEGLGGCLEQAASPAAREAILGDVFSVYRWDVLDTGGYGMDEAPGEILATKTTAEERG